MGVCGNHWKWLQLRSCKIWCISLGKTLFRDQIPFHFYFWETVILKEHPRWGHRQPTFLPYSSRSKPLPPSDHDRKPNSHESVTTPLRSLRNGDVTIATHITQQPIPRRQTQKNRDKVQYPVSPLLALNVTSLDHLPMTSKATNPFTTPKRKN